MFYLIESLSATLWQPQNLLTCIELCLRTLRAWAEEGSCPNFFIPYENMFLGKVYGTIKSNLVNVLHDLVREKGKYLTEIQIFKIGQKLIRACLSSFTDMDDKNEHCNFYLFTVECLLSLYIKNDIFIHCGTTRNYYLT
ncbi:hypothetical protein ACJMK2_010733 [Sinanodonta woodiana]|uniref:Mab-21-like HhH/H2TH-like domain-containing protein n=1 Tax=Sinanodonta woodiana TaxID=1069815 RepID=A0ABD3VGF7_SINWO